MTDHQFKNGIEIHIPDGTTFQQWTDSKMIMDILIGLPSKEPVNLYKILEPGWPSLKRPKPTSRKSYHRVKKSGWFLK